MKKAIATILLFVLSSAVVAVGANIEVSQPTHSTNNSEYDRNPSITYYNGSYWLFFTKGDDTSTNGVRGPGYNPDADGYVVWSKTAATIEGLTSATETKLNLSETNRPSGFDQRVVTAVIASDGSSDCIYAIVSSGFAGPSWPSHGMYHYKWDGSSWTGPVMMVDPGGPDQYGAHVNAVSDGSTIYIVWDSAISNFFTYDPSTGMITGPSQISTDNMPKITLMGTVLYVVSIEDGTGDIEVRHSPNYGLSWFSHSTAIPGAGMYDPCIFNDGTNLYVVTAPWVPADRQYLVQTMSIGAGTTWSTPRTVSYGGYGSTEWWDYWPIGYYDGADAYVFFTTETSSPAYSDGEIAFTKMDWDLGNDHYFYIQNAIDQAIADDVINVAAGTYVEQVTIDKSLNLAGAGESVTTIQAPSARTGTVTEGSVTWDYIVAAYPSSGTIDIKIDGFTIDANNEDATDTDNLNFAGMFFRDVGDGTDDGIYSCSINNFGAYGAVWSSTYNTWMGNYGVVVYGTSDLDVDDDDIGDYTVSGVSAKGTNVDVTVNGNNFDGSSSDYVGVFLRDGAGAITSNTITNHYGVGENMGIYLYDAAAGVNISSGNTISNNFIGIFLAGTDGATIDGNSFTNSLYRSIVIQQDSDNNIVSDNTITMVTGDVSSGIYIGSNSGGNVIGGNSADDGNDITLPADGIGMRYCIHLAAADIDAVTIKNNSITGGMRGIQFDGGPGHSGTNTISDNTITGSAFGGIMSYCHGDFVIEGNTVSGTDRPLEFWQAGNGDIAINDNKIISSNFDGINAGSYSSMTISGNSFEQLAGGLSVYNRQTSTVINASGNWWGTTLPTEVAGKVSSHVDFTPWLGGGTDTNPGFQGDFSELYVDDDSPQTGTETRIQEGVDLVTGSTVNVMNGSYGANPTTGRCVYITIDGLNLIGESESGTIIDGSIGGVGSSGSYWPKGIHIQANNVTIEKFTVDGFTGDMVSTGGYGILHRDYAHDTPGEGYIFYSGCTVNNVTVQNCYSVIYALCFTNLTVSYCNVVDNYSDGMFIARGCDNAVVHDNTVTNSGDHGIWVGKCWMGLDPSHNATIYNNDVNGAREGGISFVGSDVAEIYGNTITNAAAEGWSVGALSLKDGPTNVNAHDNTIYNNSGTWNGYNGYGHGVGIDGAASSITLYHNSIYGNSGFNVYNGSAGLAMGSWNKRLIEDDIPLSSDHMVPADPVISSRESIMAEQNWWGTVNCPAITASMSGDVDFEPYCNDDFSDCGFTCYLAEVWVDDSWTGPGDCGGHTWEYDAFAVIQDGIDAVADNGIVHVADGTYNENIAIGKTLILDGVGYSITNINASSGNTVTISADNVELYGFTISGGTEGINCSDVTGLNIHDNEIDLGSGADNIGINFVQYVTSSQVTNNNIYAAAADHQDGIRIKNGSDNNQITGNEIYNTHHAIKVHGLYNTINTLNNTIEDNQLYNNDDGIFIWNNSGYTQVINNYIHDNVEVAVKLNMSENNTFTGNRFESNGYGGSGFEAYGVLLLNWSDLGDAAYNNFENNLFINNSGGGVILWDARAHTNVHHNTFTGNTFAENGGPGISIDSYSHDNQAYYNMFMCNSSNAVDDGPNNSWDNGVDTGNFWDDWTSNSGYPTQYNVPGTAGSVDNYPWSISPSVVWVDDSWAGTACGDSIDGHLFGYDAFDNIQAGVDAVFGSTVNVAVGTYTENIVIAKSLDLIGADRTTTIIDGNNIGNTVTITASDVTLSGFTVTGGWENGLDIFHPVGGVVVDGNSGDTSLTGITIENNIVDGNSGNGVYVSAAGHGGVESNVVIRNCQISNNGTAHAGICLTHPNYIIRPVGVWDEWRRPKNILVQENTVYSNSSYGIYVSAGQDNVIQSNIIYDNSKYGMQLASSWNRTDIPCEYTTVENNDIYDNVRNGVKLTSYNQYNTFTGNTIYNNGSGGSSDYYKYGFLFQDGNNNTIQSNTITGNALGGLYLWGKGDPSYTWYSTTDNSIIGNTISNHTATGGHGIYVPVSYGNPNSGFLNSNINGNKITDNLAYGLENADATQIINASGNWWGTTIPGEVAGKVSSYVDYTPWLGGGTDTNPGFQGDFSELWVDDDSPQTGTYGRVQEGINEVTGSTVNLAAGTFEEQVVIDKNLTLTGAGKDVTIIESPVALTQYFTTSADNYPIVYIYDADVDIENLTVDGLGRGNANYRFVGIGFWNAGGSVNNVRLTGVRDEPFSGAQHGVSIYSYNDTDGPYTIDVTDVDIDDMQKTGVALCGNGLTANVSNCTVTGQGATDVTAQNGIQIGFGAGGTVTDCSVTDIAYTGSGWVASGMLFYWATTVDVSGTCTITNSQSNIVFQGTNGSVDGATVTTSGVNNEEGISIRDYGYTRMKGNDLSFHPVSPMMEEWNEESGQKETPTTISLSNLNLTGVHGSASYGIAAWSIGDDVTVTVNNCTVQDWEIGLVAYEDGSIVDVAADHNTIASNDLGCWTNAASTQMTEHNYWGTINCPAITAMIDGNVDFEPYCNDDFSDCSFICDVNVVWVDDDWTGSSDGQDLGGGKYYNYNAFDIIMDGITAVTDYGTVNVAVGVYHNDITAGYWDGGTWVYTNRIDKSITLLGAQADVDPAGGTAERPGGESILTRDEGLPYSIVAPDVVINGFMNGSASPNTGGRFIVGDDADDVEIKYCIIQNTPSGSSGHGIYVYPGAVNAGISYNTIANTAWEGIRNDGNASISYNTIRDIPSNKGIMFGGSGSGSISNNTISNTFYEGIAAFASASITGNDISGCYHGIQIRGNVTNYTINGNNIHNNQYHGIEIPNYSGEVVAGATITNNTFTDNPYCGVKVGGNTDGSGYHINNNTFVGNGIYAVESSTTADVDAEHNWWGAYCGPYHPTANPNGEGNAISDNVDFDPWCNDDFTDCTFSLDNPPSVVWVDDDYTATGYNNGHLWCYDAFDNIQSGLTAVAEGGTINALMGTYTEVGQIVIDKDVTISGAGVGNTIVMKNEDTGDPSSGDNRGWFLVNSGYTLSMNDVTLDGDTRQICIAVLSFGEVAIEDCEIKNIGWTPSSYYGRGVCLYGGTANFVNQTTFTNIYRIGIFTFGSGVSSAITDCNYTGKGDGDWLDYAFEAGGGAAVTISNNTITNCTGIADVDGSASAGILITTYFGTGTAADITGSDISNSTLGIAIGYDSNDESVVSVTDGNLIYNNETGIHASNSASISLTVNENAIYGNTDFGISAGVDVSVDAEANWWGDASGPALGALASGQTGAGFVQPSDVSGDNTKQLAQPVMKSSPVNVKDDKGSAPGLITYGSGDAVTGNVDYSPWWGGNYVADPHMLPWTWYVDTSNNSTIQEGVNWASNGDAVYLTDDTFTNPINIDDRTNITIIGLDKSTSIYKPVFTQSWAIPGYESRQVAIRVYNSHEIKLSNMTIDLDDVKGNNVAGILFWNSEGEISDNDIKNNCVPDGDGGYYEITSYLRAPDYSESNRADILVRDNNFTQTGRLAIVTHEYIHAVIINNIFDQEIDDFGYAIEMGSISTGVISDNIILNYDTPAASDGSSSAGLYVENAFTSGLGPITKDVTIEGNEIYNCQFGIHIGNEFDGFAGDVDINAVIQNNYIHDNVDGGVVVADEDRSAGSSVALDFSGNIIDSNGDVGVYIYTNGDGEIHSVFDNDIIITNVAGILIEDEAQGLGDSEYDITINNSEISGNSSYGINNLVNTANTVDTVVVNAEGNDWGHNTGPYHPEVCPKTGLTNPLGQGDQVSNYVDYDPWYMGGCVFVPGDINGDGRVIGSDVTYGVNFFIGIGNPPPDSCWNDSTGDWHYSAADANGDCLFIGSDITYMVQYFLGADIPPPTYCPQTPPADPVLSVEEGTIIENEMTIPLIKFQSEVKETGNSLIPVKTQDKASNWLYH